jgi:hypothetical protein
MRHAVILIACVLPLAACNKQPEVHAKNASVAEVESKMRDAREAGSFIRPGKWQTKTTVEEISVPGMPAEFADQMKKTMAMHQEQTFETCLTEADVKRPGEDFFTGKNNECRYDHFTMAGGKIDAELRCGGDKGGQQVMTMAGTYSPDAYQMQMSMKSDGGEGPQAGMSMSMRANAKRVGACTGKES